ncbi:unnamed protein product [Urochloa decumbens]|uniref:F-box domain-containing protein n=1 Tax=Urochloa decumbens TaxID=240449 RepID=A0ABC9D9K7_9POAL
MWKQNPPPDRRPVLLPIPVARAATSMAPPPPPAAALIEELVEEILLRLPPTEPASLFRAALVCKAWCRLISGARFCRRFREFHRTPPMLGLICSSLPIDKNVGMARFVPATAFCSPPADRRHCRAIDARHGRVLLLQCCAYGKPDVLVVWDPITGDQRELPTPPRHAYILTAAILCAAAGICDHLDCHRGPFLVVFMGFCSEGAFICTYSPDAGTWSDNIYTDQPDGFVISASKVLVGNALYFGFPISNTALRYDLELHETCLMELPPRHSTRQRFVLLTMDDGAVGFATVHEFKLYMWSRKDGPQVDAGWTQNRVIELQTLLRSNGILASPDVVGFADGLGVVFLREDDVLFTIDLKSCEVKKLSKGRVMYNTLAYMRFYTPALGAACTGEGSSTGASGA